MNVKDVADRVREANDARLNGVLSRADHAKFIKNVDDMLTVNGFTWDDVQEVINR
jgi:hypothetical protein